MFDFFPLIYLFLPRTYPRQNLLNARKFNVARSGVIVQCLGRNRPSTTSTGGNFVLLQEVPL